MPVTDQAAITSLLKEIFSIVGHTTEELNVCITQFYSAVNKLTLEYAISALSDKDQIELTESFKTTTQFSQQLTLLEKHLPTSITLTTISYQALTDTLSHYLEGILPSLPANKHGEIVNAVKQQFHYG